MFKVPDLRNKILFTLLILAFYRFGSHIPTPGVSFSEVERLEKQAQAGGVLGFLSFFSGGALTRFAIFGLGIMPYITSSIIMQVLTVVIPKLEQWQEQGAVGQKKLTQWTRYLTVVLALVQSTGLTYLFHKNASQIFGTSIDLIPEPGWSIPRVMLIVLSLTAGTALIMWMGEVITQRGIGNGMSLIIFASVVSRIPAGGAQVKAEGGMTKFLIVTAMAVFVLVSIVFVEQGQRRIPIQFAKRVVGRRMYGGQSSYIPLKVNQSGVIPIIFASSVLYLPVLLTNVIHASWFDPVNRFINDNLLQPDNFVYIAIYGVLIIFFAYFYTAITFDPVKQADTIRKQGGFIPGIRPGPQTERHLAKILSRITLPGALFIATVALLPTLLLAIWDVKSFDGFGGTSLLIAVGVALETMKQIDSQLMMRNYESFLK
jgi:preprotein translocase subunit SecY